jgi:ABC-type sugar transport system ATPase subunit
MEKRAVSWLATIEADVDPATIVGSLSVAKQQLVQIAGALGAGARILIFDEPTSALGVNETMRLLQLIKDLKAKGVACVYVSHRLDEIYEVCDTATVLRDGQFVETVQLPACDRERLVSLMIGRKLEESLQEHSPLTESGEPLLEVQNLCSPGRFENISLTLRPGEILGIGGLVGAGRTEILEAIFGIGTGVKGTVRLNGKPLLIHSPTDAVRSGLGLVPEDRKRHGLVLSMNCRENISLPTLGRLSRAGFIRAALERAMAVKYFGQMRVKAPTIDTNSISLSGGNQQKVVMAKWLGAQCDVLLVDEPTRGVDVGAKAEIHALLRELAASGKGVLVVSSELPELMALSHRIIVLRQGRVVGEEAGKSATEGSLMRLMAGLA